MKSTGLGLAVLVLTASAFSWAKDISFECDELAPGASQSFLQTFPVRNKFVAQITINIEAKNIGTEKASKCHVQWSVRSTSAGHTRLLFRHEDDPAYSLIGASLNGTSPDGSKILLDFYTAGGDYTDHHPLVYDFLTAKWAIRDVGTRITEKLPRCDYSTFVDAVTNDGNVVISVPKSVHVDKGCPDQGEWLLNMQTDTVSRVEAHAPSSKPSAR
jgi:hypothetical protein